MTAMLKTRFSYANVMSTVAVFLALGGGAWAVSGRRGSAAAVRPSATVRACVTNSTGAARIIRGFSCRPGERLVSWGEFSGHFASPSGAFTLDVTDAGIVLGEHDGANSSTLTLAGGSLALNVSHDVTDTAGGSLTNTAGGSLTDTSGGTLTNKSSGGNLTDQAAGNLVLRGATTQLGGCASGKGVARLADPVSAGAISGASSAVFAC